MGSVKIPYYVVIKGRGYWRPTAPMRLQGFSIVRCGKDGPDAWRIAAVWNERWQAHRRGLAAPTAVAVDRLSPDHAESAIPYPRGSLGEAFNRLRRTPEWERKAPRTREDWWRGWKRIKPFFGDVAPSTVTIEHVSTWRAQVEETAGRREAHRALKIWRALWKIAAAMHYCERQSDPSLGVRNTAAIGRGQTWSEGEAVQLVKAAWRAGYRGLAVCIAIMWDTQLSPGDARALTAGQLKSDLAFTARAKTGTNAGGLLSRRTVALVDAYRGRLGFEVLDSVPLIRSRGLQPTATGGRPRAPAPYSKDAMAEDFRVVRELAFGAGERRQMRDLRRSGAMEAIAGEGTAEALAHAMGNTLSASNALFRDYVPVNMATLRSVKEARQRGRQKLREGNDR